ncbi:hypothetical protein ACFWA9_10200 [Kitasatospora sp. NPDC059973]|uniref:hypothetical protein n=1 Tax=Kitasatospora sp. NPDC059973 TaxID=3347020 RepID=UPI0036898343
MNYAPDAPADPRERLVYLAERADLLAEIEEKVERLAHAQERQPYPGPSETVLTAREGAETLRQLADQYAEDDLSNPEALADLHDSLRTAEALVEQLQRLAGPEEAPAVVDA